MPTEILVDAHIPLTQRLLDQKLTAGLAGWGSLSEFLDHLGVRNANVFMATTGFRWPASREEVLAWLRNDLRPQLPE